MISATAKIVGSFWRSVDGNSGSIGSFCSKSFGIFCLWGVEHFEEAILVVDSYVIKSFAVDGCCCQTDVAQEGVFASTDPFQNFPFSVNLVSLKTKKLKCENG